MQNLPFFPIVPLLLLMSCLGKILAAETIYVQILAGQFKATGRKNPSKLVAYINTKYHKQCGQTDRQLGT